MTAKDQIVLNKSNDQKEGQSPPYQNPKLQSDGDEICSNMNSRFIYNCMKEREHQLKLPIKVVGSGQSK